ncbi:winged helix-turn-helix transcriptional regulator [Demequina subtropica]|uniref:winged helix-turn-helix transcriptional regulator n=1 Tax=Demequina subtropica TaxID=1638989 RepID=UPI0007808641|nr:helix-turn-helix domain-containing protein [Demequina subtropica]
MGAPGCPIERAVRVLDGKWTLLILRELFDGKRRFGELLASLPGASPKTLTDRLRALEAHGVVAREVFPEIPPRVEYSLTPLGRTLAPVIDALRAWGEANPGAGGAVRVPEATRARP